MEKVIGLPLRQNRIDAVMPTPRAINGDQPSWT
jgi:hypothetical protein